ncbi:MAG: GNAT family N-acetyltransferase [Magnetococcus sp. YQC-9]
MNPFLSEAWLRVMLESGSISAIEPVELGCGTIHVGVVRAMRQSRWVIYGSWPEPDDLDLMKLFLQAQKRGAYAVESCFNMARWPEERMLSVGATILESFGTFRVDLTRDEKALWMGLEPTHRNKIRRARALGVEIVPTLHQDCFVAALNSAYERGGRDNPFHSDYFVTLERHMSNQMLRLSALVDGRFQAGALILFDPERGYYLHGAAIDHPVTGAANLLHWEAMRILKSRGVAGYDFGGARRQTEDLRLQGIFRFKAHFGGRFEPCCYWVKIVHPLRHRFYRVAGWLHDRVLFGS